MKKTAKSNFARRMLSIVMVLLMACPWVAATPALAAADWSNLAITVSWQNGENTQTAYASPVQGADNGVFWVQVDSSAPFENLALSISDPSHPDYRYDAGNGVDNLVLTNVKNASGLNQTDGVYITAFGSDNNQVSPGIILYISTSVAPAVQAAEADIKILYKDTKDNKLGESSFHAVEGQPNVITPDQEFEGYTLTGDTEYTITFKNGQPNMSSVTFLYEPPAAAEADIQVLYKDTNNKQLGEGSFHAVEGQPNIITPEKEFEGYTLTGDTEYTITFSKGQPNMTSVTFLYEPPAAPAEADIQVLYMDTNNKQLGEGSFHAVEGQPNVITPDKQFEGYTLTGDTEYTITFAQGQPNMTSVIFLYEPPAAAEADIQVLYKDTNNKKLGEGSFHAVEGQPNVITPDKEFEGYTLTGDTEYTITFSKGQPNVTSVTFLYEPPAAPAEADIQVLYKDTDNNKMGEGSFHAVEGQPNVITPDQEFKGYTLTGDTEYTITFSQGQPNTNSVTFYFKADAVEPAKANIAVTYQVTGGGKVLGTDTFPAVEGGDNHIGPKNFDGYTLVGPDGFDITFENGQPSQTAVTFEYEAVQAEPAKANIAVTYQVTGGGKVLGTDSFPAVEGEANHISPKDFKDYTLVGPAGFDITFTNGQPSATAVTFEYKAVEVPPTEPAKADIAITYQVTGGGKVLGTDTFPAVEGEDNHIGPKDFNGYTLEGPAGFDITFANGQPSTTAVTFEYKAVEVPPTEPAKANVTVTYQVTGGGQVLGTDTFPAVEGEANHIGPKDFGGYTLVGPAGFDITFTNGQPSATAVKFEYAAVQVEPAKANIAVTYQVTGGGQVLGTDTFPAVEGQANHINPKTFSGYTLVGPAGFDITFTNGQPSATAVTFEYKAEQTQPVETPVPVGSPIDRWSVTNSNVNFRSTPAKGNNNLIRGLNKDTHVWMYESEVNEAGETWTRVRVDGQDGYIMTDFLDMMTQADSDAYQATLPTPMPSRSPTPAPSVTPPPAQYTGYALTTKQVALRIEVSTADSSILKTLPKNTLVEVMGQVNSGSEPWSLVQTLDSVNGYVPDSALRHINAEEAQFYINQYNEANKTPTPSPEVTPVPTPTPAQQSGYAKTLGDNVPMRAMADANSALLNVLAKNMIVYVSSQEFINGQTWHIVQYNGQWGYIRADQLRWLSRQETTDYLNSLKTPAPTPATTPQPVDENSPSSYGYVNKNSVNFRATPGDNGKKIGTLNQYAFALILGSTQVNGTTWYKVNQSGKEGYIRGDLLHVLTLAELTDFLQSPQYSQGTSGGTSGGNVDNTGNNNGPSTPEDWNVGTWTNPNAGAGASYEPFDPYASPEPLPTESPSPSPEPEPTITMFGTLPPPNFPTEDTQTNQFPVGWLIFGVMVLGGFGGLYAYALHKSNQRKAAARAAQRRAAMQQQQGAQNGARPYARTTNAPMVPPTAGTQNRQAPPTGAPTAGTQNRPAAPTGAPRPQGPGSNTSGSLFGQQRPNPYAPPSQAGQAQRPAGAGERPAQAGTAPVNRPQGGAPAARPAQQPGAQNGPAAQRPTGPDATSRQPRTARHTGNPPADGGTPADTNENL